MDMVFNSDASIYLVLCGGYHFQQLLIIFHDSLYLNFLMIVMPLVSKIAWVLFLVLYLAKLMGRCIVVCSLRDEF